MFLLNFIPVKPFFNFTLLLFLATGQMMAQSGQDLLDLVHAEQAARTGRLKNTQIATPANGQNIDVIQYRAHWWLNPESDSIRGKVAIVFRPASGPVSATTLDLASNMVVESARFRNIPVQFSFTGNSTLNLNFGNQQLNPGQTDSLVIRYRGKPVPSAFGSFTRTQHNGNWLVYTLSEPYGAKDWWPCKQALSDKADSIDISLYTPAAYTAVSNGLLVSEGESGGIRTFRWKHKYPIVTYLIAVAATNYSFFRHEVVLASGDTLPVDNYCYPENLSQWQSEMQAVTGMLSHFDTLLSPYPFPKEKYGHTQFAFGGGMEHQTNSFMQNTNFGLQAHELVHQWFGNKITCHSWEDIWLNEGFATFFAAREYVRAGYSTWPFESSLWIDFITSEPGGSVFCSDTSDLFRIFSGRLSYAKGAMLLHMLRWKLGDAAFWQGIRNYINQPALAFGFARTSDFVSIMESSSGQNLSEFFADWQRGEGYPSIQLNAQMDGDSVRISVSQVPSHPSVTFFEMDVPIRLKNSQQDTLFRLPFSQNGQNFVLYPGFQADSLFADPEKKWLARWNVSQTSVAGRGKGHSFIRFFPNPAAGTLRWTSSRNQDFSASVRDLSGRIVLSFTGNSVHNELDLSRIPPGMYVIHANTNKESGHFPLLKE